jgi:hypothetical protein
MIIVQAGVAESGHGYMSSRVPGEGCGNELFARTGNNEALTRGACKIWENCENPLCMKLCPEC